MLSFQNLRKQVFCGSKIKLKFRFYGRSSQDSPRMIFDSLRVLSSHE
jgi:hypothetical protein